MSFVSGSSGRCGGVFVGFCIAIFFIEQIFDFIMKPLQAILPAGGKLIYTEPTEAFMLYMKMAALAGLLISLAVADVAGVGVHRTGTLRAREAVRDPVRDDVDGVFHPRLRLFSHYVAFPAAWNFFGSFADETVQFAPRIEPVFSLYVRMALGLGAVFEMPTLVMFLARVGLVTPRFLIRHTKYAILIIFIVAAIVTPGSDPLSLVPGRRADDRVVRLQHPRRVGVQEAHTQGRSLTHAGERRDAHAMATLLQSNQQRRQVSHRIVRIYLRIGLTATYVVGTMRW